MNAAILDCENIFGGGSGVFLKHAGRRPLDSEEPDRGTNEDRIYKTAHASVSIDESNISIVLQPDGYGRPGKTPELRALEQS